LVRIAGAVGTRVLRISRNNNRRHFPHSVKGTNGPRSSKNRVVAVV
jgi:hypothetical protein